MVADLHQVVQVGTSHTMNNKNMLPAIFIFSGINNTSLFKLASDYLMYQ